MKKSLLTIAALVVVALIGFACGTMVTDVEAQPTEIKYIGVCCYGPTQVGTTKYGAQVYLVYEENGVVKKKSL